MSRDDKNHLINGEIEANIDLQRDQY